MERNTIIAIVISVIIFAGWMIIQGVFFKSPEQTSPNRQTTELTKKSETGTSQSDTGSTMEDTAFQTMVLPVENDELTEKDVRFETDVYLAVFTTRGGLLKSLKLKQYMDLNNVPVDMVVTKDSKEYPFELKFGDYTADKDLFSYHIRSSSNTVEFSREYTMKTGEKDSTFIVKKIFSFSKDKYFFEFKISIESVDKEYLPLDFDGTMYTLVYGPQIGPDFKELTQHEYRHYLYYANGARKDFTGDVKTGVKTVENMASWLGIEGKYFIALAFPSFIKEGEFGFDARQTDGIKNRSSIYFKRPYKKQFVIEDIYKFFIGPKKKELLNEFSDLYFDKAIEDDWLLGWLNAILQISLSFIHTYVGNWGVAIIILTLIIKLIFFPLTQKSFKSNQKMQALAPKINELKEKYKENPQKMQVETAALYKKEGINPLGGCLPLLIQIPFFISFYNILSKYFELRGAIFIPGWINDLSVPEHVFELPFSIPILGPYIRLLPFIMICTTFIQQLLSQKGSVAQQTTQTKLLMFGMPIVFFFILYNMPSGLTLYWTMQNFFSVIQQLIINIQNKNKPVTAPAEGPKIVKKKNVGVKKQ
ncbi:MAG: membrane protein insertase YidC [Spirochaetales bacterium]|nr:membrane protein insertase YidC [Spirochaetales bacterium]